MDFARKFARINGRAFAVQMNIVTVHIGRNAAEVAEIDA